MYEQVAEVLDVRRKTHALGRISSGSKQNSGVFHLLEDRILLCVFSEEEKKFISCVISSSIYEFVAMTLKSSYSDRV